MSKLRCADWLQRLVLGLLALRGLLPEQALRVMVPYLNR